MRRIVLSCLFLFVLRTADAFDMPRIAASVIPSQVCDAANAGYNMVISQDSSQHGNLTLIAAIVNGSCTPMPLPSVLINDDGLGIAVREWHSNQSQAKAALQQIVTAYTQSGYTDHVWGYLVYDEPGQTLFSSVAGVLNYLEVLDPNHQRVVNLFPDYATPCQFSGGSISCNNLTAAIRDFASYVSHFFGTAGLSAGLTAFSVDEYTHVDPHIVFPDRVVDERGNLFNVLSIMRTYSSSYNLPFLQVTSTWPAGTMRSLSEAEERYDVFQQLVFGSFGYAHFVYTTPPRQMIDAIETQVGVKTAQYYQVQDIGLDLAVLDSYLGNLSTLGTTVQSTAFNTRTFTTNLAPRDTFVLFANNSYRASTTAVWNVGSATYASCARRVNSNGQYQAVFDPVYITDTSDGGQISVPLAAGAGVLCEYDVR